MKEICQKCHKEFLALYEGICHQCWTKTNENSIANDTTLKIYRCPACDKTLFKGNVKTLAMNCPRCNEFVRIDRDESLNNAK